jgi:hypothetical protein
LALFWRKNFDDLFGVDCHTRAFEEYPNLPACGLIHDSRYLSLDKLPL